jgi:hypothetical protein
LVEANKRVLDAGGFSGSNLDVDKAARALGLRLQSRTVAGPTTPASAVEAHAALQTNQKLVIAGVDYKPGRSSSVSDADHFLLIKGPADPSAGHDAMTAVDPAGGREITFHKQPDGTYRAGNYKITEFAILAPERNVPPLANQPLAA